MAAASTTADEDLDSVDSLDPSAEPSGATQAMAAMRMDAASDVPPPPMVLPVHQPLPQDLLNELLEQEILRHFEIVRAAQATAQGQQLSAASTLATFDELLAVLRGLAYDPTSSDCWQILGLSPLEGPEPTIGMLEARARTARLLSSAAEGPRWAQGDKQQIPALLAKIELAVQDCASSLAGWRKERRKLKPSKLPLWKELGPRALRTVVDTALSPQERIATQWSALLGTGPPGLQGLVDARLLPLDGTRRLADGPGQRALPQPRGARAGAPDMCPFSASGELAYPWTCPTHSA